MKKWLVFLAACIMSLPSYSQAGRVKPKPTDHKFPKGDPAIEEPDEEEDLELQITKKLEERFKRQLEKQSIIVVWDEVQNPDIASYNVYFGEETGKYTHKIELGESRPTTQLDGISTGKIYYFAVTAVDKDGAESPFSDEVTFTGGYVKNVEKQKGKLKLTIIGAPGWSVNLGYKSELSRRYVKSFKNESEEYTITLPDLPNRTYFIIEQDYDDSVATRRPRNAK